MATFISANNGAQMPLSLRSIGFVHPRRFVVYAEIENRHLQPGELNDGCEAKLDAEAIGGPDDGWIQEQMQSARILPANRRLSRQFMVLWSVRLPLGEWMLRLWINERLAATRMVQVMEVMP